MAKNEVMLSTIDNPYNPFDDFKKWFIHDEVVLGHHCSSLLAKFATCDIDASDNETKKDIESAIDHIVLTDPTGIYIKVRDKNQG